ncbi:hypothetical protein BB8028_0001g12600 [Beauveria bassiana]|uniref:Uncharacterized protein n=1 Tax=Beauveria bassiana TaxID=176275 RepID=A0A2S7XZF2_BEABA|nr:hypothetical protein BB8028_0001g12600 [Beauveria bassiana]
MGQSLAIILCGLHPNTVDKKDRFAIIQERHGLCWLHFISLLYLSLTTILRTIENIHASWTARLRLAVSSDRRGRSRRANVLLNVMVTRARPCPKKKKKKKKKKRKEKKKWWRGSCHTRTLVRQRLTS